MISPGGLVATLFSQAGAAVAAAVDATFNYVSLLVNGGSNKTFISDASANNVLITPAGSVRNDNFSPFQGDGYYSTRFDGSSALYGAASNTSLAIPASTDFTIEAWVNLSSPATEQYLINYGAAGSGGRTEGWHVGFNGGAASQINFYIAGANFSFGAGSLLTANAWNHVAIIRSGGVIRNYINGIQSPSTWSNTNGSIAIGAEYWGIGGLDGVGNGVPGRLYLNGYVSNLRVVIGTAVYTGNFAVPTGPLTAIANTKLLTCQSASFKDNSGNALVINNVVGTPKISYNQPVYSAGQLKSVKFNGTTDYLVTPSTGNPLLSGDFTIECWVYDTSANTAPSFIGMNNDATRIAVYSNRLDFYCAGTEIWTDAPVKNQWVHYAMTRSGTTLRAFKNGVQFGSATGVTGNAGSATSPIYIGKLAAGYPAAANISNVRIVDGTALYTADFTPSTSSLTAVAGTVLLTCQGSIADASPNAVAITVGGAPVASYSSPFAYTAAALPTTYGAGYFNGTTDYLTTANTSLALGTSAFTMEAWVYPTSRTTAVPIISKSASTNATSDWCVYIAATTGLLHGEALSGSGYVGQCVSSAAIPLNTWTHVAWVRSGSTFTLYVNGASVATATSAATAGNGSAQPIRIGWDNGYSGGYFPGYISNVHVATSAVYTGAFTPSTAPLTAVAGTQLLTLQAPVPAQNTGFIDTSAVDANITTVGTPAQGTFSPFSNGGWSGYFNGSTDYLTTASTITVGANNFTFEAWIYPNATQVSSAVLFGSSALQVGYNGTTGFGLLMNSVWVSSTTLPTANAWNHVAIVRNGTTISVFVNGNLTATGTNGYNNAGYVFYIGSAVTQWFAGYMSNLVLLMALQSTLLTLPYLPLR